MCSYLAAAISFSRSKKKVPEIIKSAGPMGPLGVMGLSSQPTLATIIGSIGRDWRAVPAPRFTDRIASYETLSSSEDQQ